LDSSGGHHLGSALDDDNRNMKASGFPWKMFGLAGLVTLVAYLAIFAWIENNRRKAGPWQFTFLEQDQHPTLLINHAQLGLTNITIQFAGAAVPTNLPRTVPFDHGQVAPLELPFGPCIFLDTLFLPGTVACQFYGYEIQVLPRTLTIDRVEYPWATSQKILLTNRPSATLPPD
jgi:hypothetical protein